jgi:phage shock protein C
MGTKELRKSKNSNLCGVCAGLAEYLGVDPTVIRIATVLLSIFSGFGIIAYIVGALIMPNAE